MKKILYTISLVFILVINGCSSVTVPTGVNPELYKKWEAFYEEPSYNNRTIYKNYIKGNKDSFVDFNRNDIITEKDLVHFYGKLYNEIDGIIKSKTDYMTNEDLFKVNLDKIEQIDGNFNKVFILSYSNSNKWNLDKRLLEYFSDRNEILQKNISYSLDDEKYIVNIRFENESTIFTEKTKLMTNGFGATVTVTEKTFNGYYLKPLPRKIEIPLEVNKAKKYDIDNLEVLLYTNLEKINERFAEERPTLQFPTHKYDFRTIFEIQFLGYKLRTKDTKEVIAQGIL